MKPCWSLNKFIITMSRKELPDGVSGNLADWKDGYMAALVDAAILLEDSTEMRLDRKMLERVMEKHDETYGGYCW